MAARSPIALLALALGACSGQYMGIDTFALAPPVAALVERARGAPQTSLQAAWRTFDEGFYASGAVVATAA